VHKNRPSVFSNFMSPARDESVPGRPVVMNDEKCAMFSAADGGN